MTTTVVMLNVSNAATACAMSEDVYICYRLAFLWGSNIDDHFKSLEEVSLTISLRC